jgi:hypothetical protein
MIETLRWDTESTVWVNSTIPAETHSYSIAGDQMTLTKDQQSATYTKQNEDNLPTAELENNAQIYQSDGTTPYSGNGSVMIWVGHSGKYTGVPAGSVTDGKLTLNLSASVDSDYLAAVSEDFPGVTIDSDAVGDMDTKILLAEGDNDLNPKEIRLLDSTGEVFILFGYCDKAFTVTGTNSDGDKPEIYQINAKAGWNRFYMRESESNRTYKTDLSDVPVDDLKWVLKE